MDKADLVEVLNLIRVDPGYYSLGVDQHEALCLTQQGDGWHVFISERGQRREERLFTLEDTACVFFLKRLLQLWPH